MKIIKVENELNEAALRSLYKDITYNWSNNVDHIVTLTEVIYEDEHLGRCKSEIQILKLKSKEQFYIRCLCESYPVGTPESFQYMYMKMLNKIKSMSDKEI